MKVDELIKKFGMSFLLTVIAVFAFTTTCLAAEQSKDQPAFMACAIDMTQAEPIYYNLDGDGAEKWAKSTSSGIEHLVVSVDETTENKVKEILSNERECYVSKFMNFKSIQEGLNIAKALYSMNIKEALVFRVVFKE